MVKGLRFFVLLILIILCLGAFPQSQKMTIKDYIEKYKNVAIKEMNVFGIPASITLAQGLLESSNGNSPLATEANNHFGIKCHLDWEGEKIFKDDDKENECFRKYNTAEESFKDHSEFLKSKSRYSNLFKLELTDYKGWAKGLKDAGYATNPKYPELLINLIEKYNLMAFDDQKYIPKIIAETNVSESKNEIDLLNEKNLVMEVKLPDGSFRKIYENNGVKFIVARKGDKFFRIVEELEMAAVWQLLKYNDLKKEGIVREGQVLYIKPKKSKAKDEFHIVKQGETMRQISQNYAVKLKKLYKKNRMEPGAEPQVGDTLFLRKKKP
ncbi:MAG: glucosaminidase domain-containing protein [Bacteroidota bacterium]|nr:glucosaminidase domain-containing protein [Bacteroidota bacterium]